MHKEEQTICILHLILLDKEIKKDGVSEECSMHGNIRNEYKYLIEKFK
jgi:hypothetical protein